MSKILRQASTVDKCVVPNSHMIVFEVSVNQPLMVDTYISFVSLV